MHTVTESDRQCARDLLAGFAHTQPPVEFMLEQCANHIAAHRERELTEAKAMISERESRLANIKFLLEPIYGSTNYAPIGGTLDRVLNICDSFEVKAPGPHFVIVGYNGNRTPCAALTVYAASAGLEVVKANAVGMLHDAGFPQVKTADAIGWPTG